MQGAICHDLDSPHGARQEGVGQAMPRKATEGFEADLQHSQGQTVLSLRAQGGLGFTEKTMKPMEP